MHCCNSVVIAFCVILDMFNLSNGVVYKQDFSFIFAVLLSVIVMKSVVC